MGDEQIDIMHPRKNQPKKRMWNSSKEFINGVKCQIEQSYGCSQIPIRKNVLMIDDDRMIYQCGKHLVEYNLLHKKQHYLIKNIEDEDITAMNYVVSQSDTLNLVVGLRGNRGFPTLKVIKKKQTNSISFSHTHVQQNSIIIDCAFIIKNKNIVSLVEEENKYCITIYGIQREKLLFTRDILNFQISLLEVCSDVPEEFYLVGPQYFQIWKLNVSEKELNEEPFSYKENLINQEEEIIECCQIPETEYMAFITNANVLYFYKQRKFKQSLQVTVSDIHLKDELDKKSMNIMKNSVPASQQVIGQQDENSSSQIQDQLKEISEPYQLASITSLFNGFVVGFENLGVVNAYEMNKRTEQLYLKGTFRINAQHIYKVLNLSSSVQENVIALCVQHAPRIMQVMETKQKNSPPTNSNQYVQSANNNQSSTHLVQNPSQFNIQSSNQIDSTIKKNRSNFENQPVNTPVNTNQNQQNLVTQNTSPPQTKGFRKNNQGAQGGIGGGGQNPKIDLQNMGRIDLYIFNYGVVDVISAAQKDAFEPLFPEGVHKGMVVDCAFCPSKSILLTLSDDKTLKNWEFSMNTGVFKCIYTTYFHENPLSVSLHPLSFQCAVGYREGLKFFFILEDELKIAFSEQNVKYVNAVSYSEWGNLCAAANYNMINIYNPNTYESIITLNGHSGFVKRIKWLIDDTMLVTNCSQGVLNCWNIWTGNRVVEHAYKQTKYNSVIYDNDLDWCVCSTQDSKVRLFDDKGCNPIYEMDVSPYNYTTILLVKELGVILFGTSAGSIRTYLWPFDISIKQQEYFEITLHQTAISSMQITKDLNYLITGSENGSIYFLKLRQFSNGNEVEISFGVEDAKFQVGSIYCINQLCLSSTSSQENKKDLIKELEFRISNLKTDQEDEKEKQVNQINQLLKNQEETNKDVIAKQKEQLSKIMEDCDLKYKDLITQIELLRSRYREQVSTMEEKNMASLLTQYQKSDDLKFQLENIKQFSEKELLDFTLKYKQIIKDTEIDFSKKYQELFERFSTSQDKLNEDQTKFKEVFRQQTDEHEEYLIKTKKQLQNEKEEEIKRSEEFRTSNSKKQKEIERFNQRKLELDSILKEATSQIEHLEEERKNFSDKNGLMQNQLQSKEEIINSKEQEIKEYRIKNNHLQNFKTVYDYQVTSLKEERSPLIDHLKNMEKNVRVMYKELLDESEASKKINTKLGENKEFIDQLKQQIKDKQDLLAITKRKIESFEYSILDMIKQEKYENWFQKMNKIYKEFFEGNVNLNNLMEKNTSIGSSLKDSPDDEFLQQLNMNNSEQIREELIKQRDFMSKKIQTISKLNRQTEIDRDDVVIRVQNENTHLIRECNTLREEKKNLKEHLGSLEKALDIITKELMRLSLDGEIQSDQEFIEKELLDFDPSKIIDKIEEEKSSLAEQSIMDSPQPKQKKHSNKKTPYQKYDEERNIRIQKIKNSQSMHSLGILSTQSPDKSIISQSQRDNQSLLLSLLKDVEKFQDDKESNVYERLKERVQNYLYTEDPSLTIPHISRIDKTLIGHTSQEETQIAQNSIISESLNVTKSNADILKQLKVKDNDSILSNKNKKSFSKKPENKSTFTLPQIKGNKYQ
ncbi:hypothetical protein ABPG72_002792 [Tetrahymena utriculariae]